MTLSVRVWEGDSERGGMGGGLETGEYGRGTLNVRVWEGDSERTGMEGGGTASTYHVIQTVFQRLDIAVRPVMVFCS